MRKKAWILLLFATLIALLCACSDTAQQPETEKPKIRIGGTTYAPYFYRNIGGNYTGIDVEIAEEACAVSGMSRSSWSSISTRALSFWMKTMWIAFGAA